MKRTLIHSMDLPRGTNARVLADGLVGQFPVSSISGSAKEQEVQFLNPASLVAVIGPTYARFFVQDVVQDADEEEEDLDDEMPEEDDPHDVAEDLSRHLARAVGLVGDEDEDEDLDDEEDEAPPADETDKLAAYVMGRLLRAELLELTSQRSRRGVEGKLAYYLERGLAGSELCEALTEVQGVAELYASDEELAAIVAEGRKRLPKQARPR